MDARYQDRIAALEAALKARDAELAAANIALVEARAEIEVLKRQHERLLAILGQHSGNSNVPPSTDSPKNRAERRAKQKQDKKQKKSEEKRKRGAQPGHKGTKRSLLPPDQVHHVVDLFPCLCGNCHRELPEVLDDNPKRYQQIDLAPIKPEVTEWRRHAVICPECDFRTRAEFDGDVIPSSAFGPRLVATVALLTGAYHLSRRRTVDLLRDLFDVAISVGSVSNIEARASEAVKAPVDEAWKQVEHDAVKHTDGTSWYVSGALYALWVVATTAATVFKIVEDGKRETLKKLFGKKLGVLISDRATALKFWAMAMRQICWAHLLRKFISFSERDGPAGAIGRELCDFTTLLFAYWHDYQDDKFTRDELVALMAPVQQHFESALERAVAAGIDGVSGSCEDILEHREALWTFVTHQGVEPTNNHGERELRAFVLWRRRSFGTQSERGNLFAERLMTVAHTARKQNKNVLAFLTACCAGESPSLFEPDALAA